MISKDQPHQYKKDHLPQRIYHGSLDKADTPDAFYFRQLQSEDLISVFIQALHFLLGFAGSGLVGALDVTKYFSFVFFMIAAFGLSFEFPVLLLALVLVGVLDSGKLRRRRRGALIGIAVFCALITPTQDWYTMTIMMVPLIIFYELSILIARFMLKK